MNPLLKWTAIAAGSLIALGGVATVLVSALVDEQKLKVAIVDLANRHLDGSLQINGDLSVSLWPALSLAVKDVHLQTPAGSGTDFAAARELRLGVALLPLLKEELQVGELAVVGLRLDAARDANGRGNWEALLGQRPAATATPADVAAGAAAAPMLLNIDSIRIEDSTLVFADARAKTRYELAGIAVRGEGINLDGDPFRLEGGATLKLGEEQREIRVALATGIDAEPGGGTVALSETSVSLTPAAGPALTLTMPTAAIDLRAHTLDTPALALASTGLDARIAVNANWSNAAEPAASGHIDLKKLDLPALLQTLGGSLPPALNPEPMQDIALDSAFTLAGRRLSLDALNLRAGQFSARGRLALGLGGDTRIDASLSSPELDLDYFLPPPKTAAGHAGEAPPATGAAAPGAAAPASGLAALLSVDGDIDAKLGRLKKGGLELGDIDATLKLARGSARLQQLEATLYDGTLSATGALSANADSGSMSLAARLAGVDLQALLRATQQLEKLAGRVNGSLTLDASGRGIDEWQRTLHGPVKLAIDDPVLQGVSVEELICKAAAQLNQESLSSSFEAVTHFQSFEAALAFDRGVGTVQTLTAAVPNMRMRGDGSIDLPGRRLDLQLNTRVTDDLAARDPACRMTRKMLAVEWPLSCKGSFDEEPGKWCGIDQDDVAKIATQLATEKVREKIMNKIGDFFNRGN